MREKKRVLIVEDDRSYSAALVETFNTTSFSAFAAYSSDEAYDALSKGGFSAIVLDWSLSNSHRGEATAKGILKKCKELLPHLPVIVLSGFAGIDVRNDALQNGADSFLTKPISLELLTTHVNRWVERVAAVEEGLWPTEVANARPLDEVERRYVLRVLSLTGENVSRAAKTLQIHRHTVASIKAAK
ncbi:MAG TPA: response regulator [Verrucomicrobiae bacterium]|nr:response regulator [Verrucomicrobiae bacterium]